MDYIQIGLAFLEGLALIASPCILPVLPLVLSTSIDGGKSRPFGIILGFIISFSLFVLLSRRLVNAFEIDLDIIKHASLFLLFLLGVVLLSSKLSERFSALTQGAASLGSKLTAENPGGFFSGIIIGALIGLIWTPCAGPILAAVLVQVILQKSEFSALIIILSFAIGAGIPMLIIALLGRKIMTRLGFFTRHAEAVRKGFGVIIILAVLFLAFGPELATTTVNEPGSTKNLPATSLIKPLAKAYPAPQFADMQWLNSEPLTMAGLKGKVVLIDFWTYSCINCIRTLPYITAWDEKYRDKGLVIVGVHSPEFEFEKKTENVKKALAKYGIKYPVALDNDLATWLNFDNSYWPAHYLIDKNGNVVYTHFGEGEYDVTENNIRYLLGLGQQVLAPPASETRSRQTPETYLGYLRSQNFAGDIERDKIANYAFAGSLPADNWSLNGEWKIEREKIVSAEAGAGLQFNFTARKVFLVLGSASGQAIKITIKLNGKEIGNMNIKDHTLYELVDQGAAKPGLLEITAVAPGLEAYAFTFGN